MPTMQLACLALLTALTASVDASPFRPRPDLSAYNTPDQHVARRALSIPLQKRNYRLIEDRTPDDLAAMARQLRGKYGYTDDAASVASSSVANSTTSRSKRQTAVPLADWQSDAFYTGRISIGTPGQTFEVIMDTGSADLIIPAPNCNGCLSRTTTYSGTSSSTAESSSRSFSIQYGSGSASGSLVRDTVSIGNYTVAQQVFAAVDEINGILIGTVSGLLGLGWQQLASSDAMPIVQALWENGTLPSPVFGFELANLGNTGSSSNGGTLTIGGVDTSAYTGEINWITSQSGTYWDIPMAAVYVNGQSLGATSPAVVVDTGTSLIGAPSSVCDDLYAAIGGTPTTVSGVSGYYSYDCSNPPTVGFTFGGQTYNISSSDFSAGYTSSSRTRCLGAVFALDDGVNPTATSSVDWIIGDSFLKGYYNAYRFSPPAVGIAQLGSGGSSTSSSDARTGSAGARRVPTVAVALGAVALVAALL